MQDHDQHKADDFARAQQTMRRRNPPARTNASACLQRFAPSSDRNGERHFPDEGRHYFAAAATDTANEDINLLALRVIEDRKRHWEAIKSILDITGEVPYADEAIGSDTHLARLDKALSAGAGDAAQTDGNRILNTTANFAQNTPHGAQPNEYRHDHHRQRHRHAHQRRPAQRAGRRSDQSTTHGEKIAAWGKPTVKVCSQSSTAQSRPTRCVLACSMPSSRQWSGARWTAADCEYCPDGPCGQLLDRARACILAAEDSHFAALQKILDAANSIVSPRMK